MNKEYQEATNEYLKVCFMLFIHSSYLWLGMGNGKVQSRIWR